MYDHVWYDPLNPLAFLERSAFVYPKKTAVYIRIDTTPMPSSMTG